MKAVKEEKERYKKEKKFVAAAEANAREAARDFLEGIGKPDLHKVAHLSHLTQSDPTRPKPLPARNPGYTRPGFDRPQNTRHCWGGATQ